MKNKQFKTGFTLIELLTVIAVVAILIAIVFPLTKSLSERAKSISCISNLRRLHSAFMLATIENDGKFPYESSTPDDSLPRQWHRRIGPFLEIPEDGNWRDFATDVYLCGADEAPYSGLLSYGINRRFMNLGQNDRSGSGNPVLIADATSFEIHSTASIIQHIRYSHSGRTANMIFLDGNVRSLSEEEMHPFGEDPAFWAP
jgi:prepilin-type N-terminal cleavage/methylation domain-containing protein/prepilin-type processing-associated H-X9-DG protein